METKFSPIFMLILFLLLFLKTHICLGVGGDTISANHSLSGAETIVSAGGKFVLGFFKPGTSSNYYIGMWYKEVLKQTIVWVANREHPVSDRFSSELKISDGNLVLFNESKFPIWSTNLNTSKSAPVQAVLLDSGNLVLNYGSNPSKSLWQSFDNPSHTFLPGSKISYNKITKTHQVLTSWKNSEDPSPGLFTLQLDETDNSYIILWNRTSKYWTSGAWNGHIFSLVPEMRLDYIYDFSFLSNENESYFTYSVKNTSTLISRCVLDASGQIKQLNYLPSNGWNLFWSQPRQQCQVYPFCGVYGSCNENSLPFCNCLTGFAPKSQSDWDLQDYSSGCWRRTPLQCGNKSHTPGEKDRFLEMPGMSLPENKRSLQVGSTEECESSCSTNCSCTAYAFDNNGCSIWTQDLLNLKQLGTDDSSGRTLYVRLAASEFHHKESPQNKKFYVILFGIIAAALVTSCIACSVYYLRRRNTVKEQGNKRNIQGQQAVSLYDNQREITDFLLSDQLRKDKNKGIQVPFVALESILAATDNFSEANKLGQGGFGPVYKGKFPEGQEIAIKRLSSGSVQGLQEFKNEVLLIAKLQHRNLVKLLGYCVEGNEQMLLYEFMANKSLDLFIFDQKLSVLLNWEIRLNIIMGIARGLLYLHHDSRLKIIHRDLKTSNVLLDEEMNPKISDFGLARIFGGTQTEANTNKIVGTYGYMSPEYALDGLFSTKSDVFSFGVVTLEIITGKRNTRIYQSEQSLSLIGYVWKLWKENRALDLMDTALSETCTADEFLRCVNVGLLCVQEGPNDRPTISDAVVMLRSETGSFPSPKQPAFTVRRSLSSRTSSAKLLSNNGLSNTLNEGR